MTHSIQETAELVHELDADGKQLRVVELSDCTVPRSREREKAAQPDEGRREETVQYERAGVRCRNLHLPPKGNANFAWVQHFIHHLAPGGPGTAGGMAGLNAVRKDLANGKSSNQSGDCNARSARRNGATHSQGLGSQRDIQQKLIEADLVDCMIALPGQVFSSTQIPVCLWFLAKNRHDGKLRAVSELQLVLAA